ncbi:MAG: hypothetical protein RL150_280 [Candidatus Parcubacteria bacterium]|jgi:uncharacterized protein (TIGR00159 family)
MQPFALAGIADIPLAFKTMTAWEVLDILLVAIALYIIILFVKQTKSQFILVVTLSLIVVAFVAQNVNLSLTRALVQPIATLVFIIIAIVLQREIRQFFRWVMVGKNFLRGSVQTQLHKATFTEVADALTHMSEHRIGAIIVFPRRQDVDDMLSGGQPLDGTVSKEVLLSIFDSSSPGHDGAVIIESNRIRLFGVHLPLAQQYTNYRKAGTRHRAAAGITEGTDAVAFVVSEERGTISVFKNGKAATLETTDALLRELTKLSGEASNVESTFWHYFFRQNAGAKLSSLALACIMWLVLFAQTGVVKKDIAVPIAFQLLSPDYQLITEPGATEVTVTIQGKSNDIAAFDTSKLQARVDAKELGPGTHTVDLTPESISVPAFISVTRIEPEAVTVRIAEAVPTEQEAPTE